MNSFPQLRTYLESEFARDAEFSVDSSELTNLGSGILNGAGLDPMLLQRLQYLLANDRDDRFICFNAEAVMFGILSSANSRYLAKDSDIQRFMREHAFQEYDPETFIGDFHKSRERKNKYIDKSQRLTKRVMRALDVPIDETQFTVGRNDICTLYFVSSDTFLRALFACRNTKQFSDYGARFMKLHTIYDSIKSKYLIKANKSMKKKNAKNEQALKKKDEALGKRKTKIEELLEQMRRENREAREENREEFREVKTELRSVKTTLNTIVRNVDELHADHTEAAYHSTTIVPEDKSPFFAITSFTKPDDVNPSKQYFRTWRTQKGRMMKELAKKMTETTTNRDGQIKESIHELIIDPLYFSSPVNIPIQANRRMKMICKEIADEHNDSRDDEDERWSMSSVIRETGIKFANVKPVWIPNDHITLKRFIGAYLDVIKDSQGRSFQIVELPDDLKAIIARRKTEYEQRLATESGASKARLQEMVDAINETRIRLERMIAPPSDDEYHTSQEEYSDDE